MRNFEEIFVVNFFFTETNAQKFVTFYLIPPHPTLSPQGRGEQVCIIDAFVLRECFF
jgi:hypothetical protein